MKNNFIIVSNLFFLIICLGIISYLVTKKPKTIIKTVTVTKIKKEPIKDVVVTITKKDLFINLKNSKLSTKQQTEILNSIINTSSKYNIPVLVLYSLIYSESSFRFWMTHSLVTIPVNGKKIKTRGVGLGGIIYPIWGKELTKKGIIETKSDLYTISANIEAIGYILDKYRKMPMLKGTTSPLESALRRYYGGNVSSYSRRIKNNISVIVYKKLFK